MSLEQFLDAVDAPPRSLAVVNRTEPEPFQRMIEKLFQDQNISVREDELDEYGENAVLLLEEDEVVAESTLKEMEDSILLVNSDLFITGTQTLERTEIPDVIDKLADSRFSLRGYPASDSEKLLLIIISRQIEKHAFEAGRGSLRSSFQRLSRIRDERGTRRVYERIASTDVDVHVYGRPDWTPSPEFPVTMHGGYDLDFRISWFVVYTPPPDSDIDPMALLAIEIDDGCWDGYWTYNQSVIEDIETYICRNL